MGVVNTGASLAGLAAAVDLVDAEHDVEMFESRPFVEGKIGSWADGDSNRIEIDSAPITSQDQSPTSEILS